MQWLGIILIIGLILIGIGLVVLLLYNSVLRIGFVPMPKGVIDELINHLEVTAAAVVVDLGAGDGRVLARIGQLNPGIGLVGYETNPALSLVRWLRYRGLEWHWSSLLRADVSVATVVIVYVSPEVNAKLVPKLTREMKPGSMVVSVQFPLLGLAGTEVELKTAPEFAARLFIYRF